MIIITSMIGYVFNIDILTRVTMIDNYILGELSPILIQPQSHFVFVDEVIIRNKKIFNPKLKL